MAVTSSAVERHFSEFWGDTFEIRLDMQNADGTARDVAGSTFVMKAITSTGAIAFQVTSPGNGWLIPDTANGQVFFSRNLEAALMTKPQDGSILKYEIDEIMPARRKTRLFGTLTIRDVEIIVTVPA